jgi:rhodanese-related sulfurtransferase
VAESRRTIDEVLETARGRIRRYAPHEAAAAAAGGAIIVDTRDSMDRVVEGVIPGSVWIPRTVLEWRADPTSELPDARIADPERTLIIVCNDGYSSSLAAASLLDLGFATAGDVTGGFRAWRAAGLPVRDPQPD